MVQKVIYSNYLIFLMDYLILLYLCIAIKCIKANAANTKGNKKCNAKNLFNVALFTEKPPHMNSTISWPIHGIALKVSNNCSTS